MMTKLIKFIILRPRGIPQNLELEINCSEIIKNLKHKLFSEDIKKELNVRFIYMGKILDDKKRLDDYINYYQKDLFSNNKSNTLINDNRNEYQSDKNKDMSNKNISNDCNENIIPITIHVKITEKCNSIKGGEYINAASNYSCMYCEEMFSCIYIMYSDMCKLYIIHPVHPTLSNFVLFLLPLYIMLTLFQYFFFFLSLFYIDNFDYKTFNTVLAQLSIIMFVTLLWLYRYNHGESFPAFSLIVLFAFTFLIITVFIYTYLIVFFDNMFIIICTFFEYLKHYFMRTWVYINEKKEEFFLRREARNNNTNAKEN
ncbi:conserved Plasmodium protein, unknown function [Plasmodium malariae]|uniref:Ubiquitin-like domain-containing protein n=2 Tax=Plasmodium (Plasmodium) TaxID=418103 RepID=A0A1D3PBV5_PLAMA|nr:conserved Plasmodium protein, unknown function [Plasmodium malariae]SCN12772.1 conserved Plasmodium protein, unknown function [Plasmodium malariae]